MRIRGFSFVELMAVVAIVGLLASLAVPNLTQMAQHYRAVEASRELLAAVSQGRAIAQRNNIPVELAFFADHVEIRQGVLGATALANPDAPRRVIDAFGADNRSLNVGATLLRVETLTGSSITATTPVGVAAAAIRFCPASDGYFRIGVAELPVCSPGDLASQTARVVFTSNGETFNIRVSAPLAAMELKQGAL